SGNTGFAFLVDEKGKVVAHPRDEYVLAQRQMQVHPLIAAYQADGKPHAATFSDEGKEAIGYVHGNHNHWALAVQQTTNEVYAPLRQTVTLGLVLLLGAALLVAAIAAFSSRMLVRPIVQMTYAAERMSMGDLDAPIRGTGQDELG